jgi:RNA polymerase sigma-70 factor (ECF subfamily)
MDHDFRGTVMLAIAAVSKQITLHAGASGSHEGVSDETLVSAIATGDRRAMRALYIRHHVRVYRFILRFITDSSLAEDIVSDVFLDVWRQAGGFKAKARAFTWILAIARYKALSVRRGLRDEQLDERAVLSIADPTDDAETMVERQGRSTVVRQCLSQLSTIHREVLDLVYYHEKSIDEVAQIVGVPASTVKTRIFYARKRMESLLDSAGIVRN